MATHEKTYTLLSAIVIVAIVFIFFLLYPKVIDKGHLTGDGTLAIPVTHQYRNSAHVYVGTATTPTPCFTVSAEAIVRESYPEQVTIVLNTKPTTDEICTQVVTEKKFKVAFQGSKEAVVSATLNGSQVNLMVNEALESVDLEGIPID